jgi:hypothetical protein
MFRSRERQTRRRFLLRLEQLEERTVLSLLGQQLFPADNPWNQKITNAPVAANSNAIINSIIGTYGDGHLHPDFGQDTDHNLPPSPPGNPLYGIPYNVVHGNTQAKVPVIIGAYQSQSDVQETPIPTNAVLEGDYQNGQNPTRGYGPHCGQSGVAERVERREVAVGRRGDGSVWAGVDAAACLRVVAGEWRRQDQPVRRVHRSETGQRLGRGAGQLWQCQRHGADHFRQTADAACPPSPVGASKRLRFRTRWALAFPVSELTLLRPRCLSPLSP